MDLEFISEHTRKVVCLILDQTTPIETQDETWLIKHVQKAIDAAIGDLIHQGMGESPVSVEKLNEIVEVCFDTGRVTLIESIYTLLTLIDFLEARIAFLSQDNESWHDGYQRGLEDGREAEWKSVERQLYRGED